MSNTFISKLDPVQWHKGLMNTIETNSQHSYIRRKPSQIGISALAAATGTLSIGRELCTVPAKVLTQQFSASFQSFGKAFGHLIGVAASIMALAAEILLFPFQVGALQNLQLQKKLGLLSKVETKINEETSTHTEETQNEASKTPKEEDLEEEDSTTTQSEDQKNQDIMHKDSKTEDLGKPQVERLNNEESQAKWSAAKNQLYTDDQEAKAKAIRDLEELAASDWEGAYNALGTLAECYLNGNGVELNREKSFHLTEEALQKNPHDAYSLYNMAYLLQNGVGCAKNEGQSKHYYQKFVAIVKMENSDNLSKELRLAYGRCLELGLGGAMKDEASAFNHYFAVHQANPTNALALVRLARCCFLGTGTNKNEQQAIEHLKAAFALKDYQWVGVDKKRVHEMLNWAEKNVPQNDEIKELLQESTARGFDKA